MFSISGLAVSYVKTNLIFTFMEQIRPENVALTFLNKVHFLKIIFFFSNFHQVERTYQTVNTRRSQLHAHVLTQSSSISIKLDQFYTKIQFSVISKKFIFFKISVFSEFSFDQKTWMKMF